MRIFKKHEKVIVVDENGNPIYANTAEFEQKFMTYDDNRYSAEFCAAYLDYLNHVNPDGNTAGNILLDLNYTDAPFLTQEETLPAVFTMTGEQEADGFIKSDVAGTYIGAGTSKWNPDAVAPEAKVDIAEAAKITDTEDLSEENSNLEEEDTEDDELSKSKEEELDEETDEEEEEDQDIA